MILIIVRRELQCKRLIDSREKEEVQMPGKGITWWWTVYLLFLHKGKSMMDPGDMFALITCRSICRHTTCGPTINAERYITYAFFNNVSLQKYSGHSERVGQRYVPLPRNAWVTLRVYVCMCVGVCVCVCCKHLSHHVCTRCLIPNLLRARNFVLNCGFTHHWI